MKSTGVLFLSFALVTLWFIEPSQSVGDQVCGPNEEYTSCGSSCPDTCESILSPEKTRVCTMNCVPGCFCKQGMVRDSRNQCIDQYMCKHPRDSVKESSGGGAFSAQVSIGWIASVAVLAAVIGHHLMRAQ